MFEPSWRYHFIPFIFFRYQRGSELRFCFLYNNFLLAIILGFFISSSFCPQCANNSLIFRALSHSVITFPPTNNFQSNVAFACQDTYSSFTTMADIISFFADEKAMASIITSDGIRSSSLESLSVLAPSGANLTVMVRAARRRQPGNFLLLSEKIYHFC